MVHCNMCRERYDPAKAVRLVFTDGEIPFCSRFCLDLYVYVTAHQAFFVPEHRTIQ